MVIRVSLQAERHRVCVDGGGVPGVTWLHSFVATRGKFPTFETIVLDVVDAFQHEDTCFVCMYVH